MSKKKEKTIFDYTSSKDIKRLKKYGLKSKSIQMHLIIKDMNINIIKERMKKGMMFIALIAMLLISTSCADSKKFKKSNGTEFIANPYGWASNDQKIDGVQYQLCSGNIVWSIILGETIIAPILFTAYWLYEPVEYIEKP